jgi:FKBP-type peptidyl-prolyl cis-trans isomerase SlpA
MNLITPTSFITLHYSFAILALDNIDHINNSNNLYTTEATSNFIHIVDTFAAGTPSTITMGYGQFPPLIEAELLHKKENDRIDVLIENAFGFYNIELQQLISQKLLTEHSAELNFSAGAVVSFDTPQGSMAGTFIRLDAENKGAWFDFNHPLAGKTIQFKAHIISVM